MTEDRVRVRPLGGNTDLDGPPVPDYQDDSPDALPEGGALTGCGTVAWISASAGLGGLWLGRRRLIESMELVVDGEMATPATGYSWASGGWTGTRRTPSGRIVREVGVLPDTATACLLQWSVDSGAATTVEVRLNRETHSVPLPVDSQGRALAVLTPREHAVVSDRRLEPVRARERQRHARHRTGGRPAAEILVDGRMPPEIDSAIRMIEESPLGDPSRPGVELFLDRFEDGGPRYCMLANLGPLGRSALTVGRPGLAWGCVRRLAEDPGAEPATLLSLTSDYFGWTADGAGLHSLAAVLKEAVLALPAGPADVLTRVLSRFEASIEPLGLSSLRAAAEACRSRLRSEAPEGRSLPTVGPGGEDSSNGGPAESPQSERGGRAPLLYLPVSTTSAARLLDGWASHSLGLRPEAAYGRLLFSPRVSTEWSSLEVSNLPVGDGAVSLALSGAGTLFEMRAHQTRGRVPMNLACEPWIPAVGVPTVLIDDEPAEVQVSEEARGTRIRFQLPLDSERRIRFSFPSR